MTQDEIVVTTVSATVDGLEAVEDDGEKFVDANFALDDGSTITFKLSVQEGRVLASQLGETVQLRVVIP